MFQLLLPRHHGLRAVLLISIMASIWFLFYIKSSYDIISSHIAIIGPSSSSSSAWHADFPVAPNNDDVADLCARYRLEPFTPPAAAANHPSSSSSLDKNNNTSPTRKIYDLLLVNTELEMLELRLAQMYPHVDHVVILESPVTFTNQPKPLHVLDSWARYAPYHDKIIRHTIDVAALALSPDPSTWDLEHASRNALFSQVIPYLAGPQAARPGDVLLVSDVDEIPKPATLAALRVCAFPRRLALASDAYYYSFQWRSSEDWPWPHATFYEGPDDTVSPQDLRAGDGAKTGESGRMQNAAWHCSYCFDSFRLMRNKLESFSHTELDKPEFKDPKAVLQRVRLGKDL